MPNVPTDHEWADQSYHIANDEFAWVLRRLGSIAHEVLIRRLPIGAWQFLPTTPRSSARMTEIGMCLEP